MLSEKKSRPAASDGGRPNQDVLAGRCTAGRPSRPSTAVDRISSGETPQGLALLANSSSAAVEVVLPQPSAVFARAPLERPRTYPTPQHRPRQVGAGDKWRRGSATSTTMAKIDVLAALPPSAWQPRVAPSDAKHANEAPRGGFAAPAPRPRQLYERLDSSQAKAMESLCHDMIGMEVAATVARSQSQPRLPVRGVANAASHAATVSFDARSHGAIRSAGRLRRGAGSSQSCLSDACASASIDEPSDAAAASAVPVPARVGLTRPASAIAHRHPPSRLTARLRVQGEAQFWRHLLWTPDSPAMEACHEQRAGRWAPREPWQMELAIEGGNQAAEEVASLSAPPAILEVDSKVDATCVAPAQQASRRPSASPARQPSHTSPQLKPQLWGLNTSASNHSHDLSARPRTRPHSAEGSPLAYTRPMTVQARARIASLAAFRPQGKAELATWAFPIPQVATDVP